MARVYGVCYNVNCMFEDEGEIITVDAPIKFFNEKLTYEDVVVLIKELTEDLNVQEAINGFASNIIGDDKDAWKKIKSLSIYPSMCYKNA